MVNSVDGQNTVEKRETADHPAQRVENQPWAGWYVDPHYDSLQRYWTGDSWSTDVRFRPASLPLTQPPPLPEEIWPPEIDEPKSLLPAVTEEPDALEAPNGSGHWYSGKYSVNWLAIPIVLLSALLAVLLLTRTADERVTTDIASVSITTQTTTSTPATTTTQPTTTTTTPATTTTTQPTTTPPTTTTAAPATTTSQAVATVIGPEALFERWVAGMTTAFPASRLPGDDRSLTESNAAFLCSRAGGDETYDSLRRFVRQFFYDAEPEYWSEEPFNVLDSYSTAYVNTSLDVYCPDVYVQLVER